ncbi:hypothetical protein N6L24_00805 [Cognatishimia sp. SS12]|uniref:hypothetical protein n=1 Tax=Cognatishimia sp. SS12 TaxID=2979465 RepID=UPI00232DE0E1|nr:hypothetical protein [Cognatishimia sp. SS12]MDC0736806.1 hypothetical protein [Cognatishimia sp. SS12]
MNVSDLVEKAHGIASNITKSEGGMRYELHEQLHRTLELIKLRGGKVPGALRRLDLDLVDEALEAQFDNMPV